MEEGTRPFPTVGVASIRGGYQPRVSQPALNAHLAPCLRSPDCGTHVSNTGYVLYYDAITRQDRIDPT